MQSICKSIKKFNETIQNILTNLIPHQTIICDDKNLPWINNQVKRLVREKNKAYKFNVPNKNDFNYYKTSYPLGLKNRSKFSSLESLKN